MTKTAVRARSRAERPVSPAGSLRVRVTDALPSRPHYGPLPGPGSACTRRRMPPSGLRSLGVGLATYGYSRGIWPDLSLSGGRFPPLYAGALAFDFPGGGLYKPGPVSGP